MSTQLRAFKPLAQTQNTAVTTTATSIPLNYALGTFVVRMCNVGSQMIFLIPVEAGSSTTATLTNAIPLAAGATDLMTMPTGTVALSVIAAGVGSTLYTTVGEGL